MCSGEESVCVWWGMNKYAGEEGRLCVCVCVCVRVQQQVNYMRYTIYYILRIVPSDFFEINIQAKRRNINIKKL